MERVWLIPVPIKSESETRKKESGPISQKDRAESWKELEIKAFYTTT